MKGSRLNDRSTVWMARPECPQCGRPAVALALVVWRSVAMKEAGKSVGLYALFGNHSAPQRVLARCSARHQWESDERKCIGITP